MRKGIVLPFLLLLASAVFILGAFFLLDTKQKTTSQKPAQTASPSPSPIVDTTSWETYTNQAFNYEFKYPNTWKIDLYNKIKEKNTVTFASPDLEYSADSGFPSYGAMINLDSEKSSFSNLEDLYTQISQKTYNKIHAKSYITIDGNEALRLDVSQLEAPSGVDIYVIKGGNLYTLQFWEINTNYSEIFNQILSTFKFIE